MSRELAVYSSGSKDIIFKLHSSTLPLKVWLDSKGLLVPWSVKCMICKQRETIEHAFIDCWDAVFFFFS